MRWQYYWLFRSIRHSNNKLLATISFPDVNQCGKQVHKTLVQQSWRVGQRNRATVNLNKSFEHVFIGKIQVESSLIGCMNCDQPSEHPNSRDRPGDVPLELPRLSTGRMSLGLSGSVPGTLQCYKIFMEIWKFLWYLENMLSKRIVQYIELTGFSGTFRKRSWDVTFVLRRQTTTHLRTWLLQKC